MLSIRTWLSRRFRLATLAMLGVQVIFLAGGLPLVLEWYAQAQTAHIKDQALAIILDPEHQVDQNILPQGPFFVFAADGSLVWSNRGKGKSIPPEELIPLTWEGSTVGYAYMDNIGFLTSETNRRFMFTLAVLMAVSLLGALAVSSFLAHRGARALSEPVTALKEDLLSLATRHAPPERTFAIEELASMGVSLVNAGRQLEMNDQYQKQFLQDLGHDLRTPLAGLSSQLEALSEGVLEPTRERLDRLRAETGRMEALVADLAVLFRAETRTGLVFEPCRPADLAAELEQRFGLRAAHKDCCLAISHRGTDFPADRSLLMRALSNVVDNALIHARSRVGVDLDQTADQVVMVVDDDGPGVPPEELDLIFQRLYRCEFSRSSPGSGLGLSIARAVMERHGGSITASNREGDGLRVTMRVPAAAPVFKDRPA